MKESGRGNLKTTALFSFDTSHRLKLEGKKRDTDVKMLKNRTRETERRNAKGGGEKIVLQT